MGIYTKIIGKYPAFRAKAGYFHELFFYRPSSCLKSSKTVELETKSGTRKVIFLNRPHNKKRLTDGSNYVILYPQNSNISYLMLYLTSDTNHEECDESCTRNTLSFNWILGRQMVRFGCKNGSLCYTKERKEIYGEWNYHRREEENASSIAVKDSQMGKISGKLKISLLYTYQNLIFLMRIE